MKIDARIVKSLEHELTRAEKLHPDYPFNSLRRTAIVCEEAGEALKAALDLTRNTHSLATRRRLTNRVHTELTHTAAVAIRALIAMAEDEEMK